MARAMIARLLVANRGEIAIRIMRTCRELGIETVAVYSSADGQAPHRLVADRAVEIGPPSASESYLSIPRLIDAARQTGADAVHPGYGFLAENAEFAAACRAAGLVFVGPGADVIAQMGSKIDARRLMSGAGLPVVPGEVPTDQSEAGVRAAAARVGLPAVIKASAGGGGKGMRIVGTDGELDEGIGAARREAIAAFGDGTLYVERLLEQPRHIEVQILGDAQGHIVHLFERECSIQRRHQKVIEESPSPALTPTLRERMTKAAVAVARAVQYVNAGTVEFLVEGAGDGARFYFLEMNTRLQVEHPVTEAVCGIDLVRAQLLVAGGAALPWTQEQLRQQGHAIECRIYAEDPRRGFLPQAGKVLLYREPAGPGVRVDSGIAEGTEVPIHYDPLLAKLVVWHERRQDAIRRATRALSEFAILGVRTNTSFLRRILDHPRFLGGDVDTSFIDAESSLFEDPPASVGMAVAAAVARLSRPEKSSGGTDPWRTLSGWRISGANART